LGALRTPARIAVPNRPDALGDAGAEHDHQHVAERMEVGEGLGISTHSRRIFSGESRLARRAR
jgi:hypothetical protein